MKSSLRFVCLGAMAAAFLVAANSAYAADGKTIGVISIDVNDQSNVKCITGIEKAAAELGWEAIIIDAHGSPDEANAAMQNLAIRGVDAIIDLVFPVTSLGMGLRTAAEEGIPVVTWGGGLADTVAFTTGSGGVMAIPIVEQMVRDMGGKGYLLALTYHTGQVARDRELAMDEILKDYPEIKVAKNEVRIPGYLQDGAEFASAWLAAHPEGGDEPLAIWGSWDDPALGAIAALKQQNRKDVLVYGQNGNIEAVVAVRDGWMTATAYEDSAEEGRVLVYGIKDVLKAGDSWVQEAREVPVIVVNADTVAGFIKKYPEAAGL